MTGGWHGEVVGGYSWDPESYMALMAEEVPSYPRLQDELVAAAAEHDAARVLDLGVGSGLTARRVADALPRAALMGVDDSVEMLAAAANILDPARTELETRRLQDPLPEGPFDLIVSMLAVHHLDGPAKADLFERVAALLDHGGRFVLGDLITPMDPDDVVTPVDGEFDIPSSLSDQLGWLQAASLDSHVRWQHRDLAVVVATRS